MKMCDCCYELFDSEYVQGEYCPKRHCGGNLVDVDDEIAFLVTQININLEQNDLPLRTLYSCSGHLPTDVPYLVFLILDYNDHKDIIYDYFSKKFQPLVDSLNKKIMSLSGLETENNYNIKKFSDEDEDGTKYYKLVIGGMFLTNVKKMKKIDLYRLVIDIQYQFKLFLLELIKCIPDLTKELEELTK